MISYDDIRDMTGLTAEEIAAIAEHEHIPEACAAALGDYLLHRPKGAAAIRRMISDDIKAAIRRRDRRHAAELLGALKHFQVEHAAELRP